MSKKFDCITFFQENFIFEFRYNVIKDFFDYLVICESKFDHKGRKKNLNFNYKKYKHDKKIIYLVHDKPFPKKNNAWQNQALQREFILKNINQANDNDYIFFSDPDEIPNPKIIEKFTLNKKFGIFFQKCFNYKFNLFNPYESPWEGTRVCKMKNLKSIDYMRQKIVSKNLKYKFYRLDKEKNIQIIDNGGWHFNNLMKPKDISTKLKTFAHIEFSDNKFSSENIIKDKINKKMDLFGRDHIYKKVKLNHEFPKFLLDNKEYYSDFVLE